ncbi:methyl-accepting chemotaxis protein [Indioceanicola profundi]|uniref:methyl-accepting chemotaxis protein n=1 Tax=Indioceanicola profundi TaxID=2220096 RepID=UPI000E6AA35E|nr:HAMP domain-containing methyl-accepting chemotaxis protein [Indioceanicola profundi]
MSLIGSLPLRRQLQIPAAIGVLGLMTIGGLTTFSALDQQNQLKAMDQAGQIAATAEYVSAQFAEAQVAANIFLAERQLDILTERDKALSKARRAVNELAVLGNETADLDQMLASWDAAFATASGAIMELGLTEKDGLQGNMRASVHAIETRLGELPATGADPLEMAQLSVLMLQMRRHEKDFMLRSAPDYVERMAKREAEFNAALAVARLPDAVKAETARLMDAYQSDFRKFAQGWLASREAINTAHRIAKELMPRVDDHADAAKSAYLEAKAEAEAAAKQSMLLANVVAAAVGLAILALSLIAARSVGRQVRQTAGAMRALAEGDRTISVPGLNRSDELGDMAGALEVFRRNAIETDRLAAEQLAEQAAKERRTAAVDRLVSGFDNQASGVLRAVSASATELDATAQSMAAIAEETSRQSGSVATAAEQTTANVQTVASAAEEMAASIREIAVQVAHSKSITDQARTEVQATNRTVEGLSDATQRIGAVIQLIQDIASQTNLLALNATIEAARAGEAGKGFAVVASEVKALATQTAKATEEIAAQVASVQQVSAEVVAAIQEIGGIVQQVDEISTSIAAAMEQQGASTQEISRNVAQAAAGTQEVSSNIAEVREAAGQTGAAASQVLGAARELAQQSAGLRTTVERFLAEIKAA